MIPRAVWSLDLDPCKPRASGDDPNTPYLETKYKE